LTSCPPSNALSSHAESHPASVDLGQEEDLELELAVQKSPNPPVVWLWRKQEEILGTRLAVRVGGSFVWPPRVGIGKIGDGESVQIGGNRLKWLRKVVFVAGGVGINPFISMLRFLDAQLSDEWKNKDEGRRVSDGNADGYNLDLEGLEVNLLYGFKTLPRRDDANGEVLFWKELDEIFARQRDRGRKWKGVGFVSGESDGESFVDRKPQVETEQLDGTEGKGLLLKKARIDREDIESTLGAKEEREGAVVYVCGPRSMTDEFVEMIGRMEGMSESRVLCERWW
jgi:hypothetical protein